MDGGADTPRVNTIDTGDTQNRYERLRQQGFVDITDGLPFKDQQDLFDFVLDSLTKQDIARFPIVALNSETGEHVYMLLSDNKSRRQEHKTLLDLLGVAFNKPDEVSNVSFTTSLEGFHREMRAGYSNIELVVRRPGAKGNDPFETFYLPLGRGSDLSLASKIALFTPNGREKMAEIFGTIGAKLY